MSVNCQDMSRLSRLRQSVGSRRPKRHWAGCSAVLGHAVREMSGGGGGIRTHGGFHLTRFRGVLLWPLGHATADRATGADPSSPLCGEEAGQQRRALGLAHTADDLGRWLSRRSRTMSHSDPTAPAFGSHAPNTSRATRASTSAPAHIVHGSSVTASVQPAAATTPAAAPARAARPPRRARSGRGRSSRSLCAGAITAPSASSTTAPTGHVALTRAPPEPQPARVSHDRRADRCRLLRPGGPRTVCPQPAFSHTATSTSIGSVPSCAHSDSRSAAGAEVLDDLGVAERRAVVGRRSVLVVVELVLADLGQVLGDDRGQRVRVGGVAVGQERRAPRHRRRPAPAPRTRRPARPAATGRRRHRRGRGRRCLHALAVLERTSIARHWSSSCGIDAPRRSSVTVTARADCSRARRRTRRARGASTIVSSISSG